ncbi:3-keto-disaccharide hydrolase [Fibrella arboris]|uniref:3-keto-disaccharide hydrolase n=1 Tax=Fibrella arboris TaxID=3242486 RepID=UPI00352163DE
MQHVRSVLAFLTFLALPAFAQKKADKEEWLSLFNGKDLSNWDIKITSYPLGENYGNTFRVEKDMIRIAYDQYKTFDGKFGHMYYKQPFSHYILRFEYRFTGNQTPGGATWNVRNSGIMFHSQSAASVSLKQDFPVSLEVQTLGGLSNGKPRPTANLCSPGTLVKQKGQVNPLHCIESTSKTYDGDQWVAVEVLVLGDSLIEHRMEGKTVLAYEHPVTDAVFISKDNDYEQAGVADAAYWRERAGKPLKEGYIALQAESHPIDFRNLKVLNLKGCMNRKAKNYKSYYVVADEAACVFK